MSIAINPENASTEIEEYVENFTSWERKVLEKVAINLLGEGLAVEMVAKVTEL